MNTTNDSDRTFATFAARTPRSTRRSVAAATVGVAVLGLGVLVVIGDGSPSVSPAVLLPTLVVPVTLLFREREVAVSEAGLVVDRSATPWRKFDGFELTDDALRVTASGWFGTQTFDRDDIEDPERVADALAEFLPRVEE